MKSTKSSFRSFTRLKLQNEDFRQNALFDAKTLKSMGVFVLEFYPPQTKKRRPSLKRFIWR